MNRSNIFALSLIVIVTSPILAIRQSSPKASNNLIQPSDDYYNVKNKNILRYRRDTEDYSDSEEERTFHRIKKKKHKFQHHQKPSHYGYFGQPILFPGYQSRPPVWKPPQAISQFVNLFNPGNHGSYGNHKPHHKPHHKPYHKPHGSDSSNHYQVWEDTQEDWPNTWSGGFFGLSPQYQYPNRYQNKVAPRSGREYRSYTTAPIISTTNADLLVDKDNSNNINFPEKDTVTFKN